MDLSRSSQQKFAIRGGELEELFQIRVSVVEFQEWFNKMNSIKSPGPDGIHPRAPEELKYKIAKLLIILSNLLPKTECPDRVPKTDLSRQVICWHRWGTSSLFLYEYVPYRHIHVTIPIFANAEMTMTYIVKGIWWENMLSDGWYWIKRAHKVDLSWLLIFPVLTKHALY